MVLQGPNPVLITSLRQPRTVFFDERSEHEPDPPDVPDPGSEAEDVEFDVTTGEELVERLPDPSEVPAEIHRAFWTTVLLANVALLALALGAMVWIFRGWTTRGGILVFVGLLAGIRVYLRVRRYERERA